MPLAHKTRVDREVGADVGELENGVGHGKCGSEFAGLDAQACLEMSRRDRGEFGASTRQRSTANSQRGANEQPGSGLERSCGMPGMVKSSVPFGCIEGIERWSARVYGCFGE